MTNKEIDPEINAIKTLLEVLSPLTPEIRSSVLSYVTNRLHISGNVLASAATPLTPQPSPPGQTAEQSGGPHIKSIIETKKPRSANEMTALVAYFLSEVAPIASRKNSINLDDIKTYFKIGDFPLPKKPQFTLVNAKNAGYLDATGDGLYKLNPVGYNLVVHSLPKDGSSPSKKRKTTRRPGKKSRG